VKLTTSGALDDAAAVVVALRDPPRIQIRWGDVRWTMPPTEGMTLASGIADAYEELSRPAATTRKGRPA
jgi:hypothetical protein